MPRETEEDMFKRVQSEARHEARLEQQRDLERRRQRKLERRKKRKQETRLRDEQWPRSATIVAPNVRGGGKAIMTKPKKKVVHSYRAVESTQVASKCNLAATVMPCRHDVGTATDPVYTHYPTTIRRRSMTTAVLEDQRDEYGHASDRRQDDLSVRGITLTEAGSEAKPGICKSKSDVGMAQWEQVWHRSAVEEVADSNDAAAG